LASNSNSEPCAITSADRAFDIALRQIVALRLSCS
jgi:hypothetical protein